jgi:hypothetical protein
MFSNQPGCCAGTAGLVSGGVEQCVCGEGGASVSVLLFVFIIVHYIISCLFVY